MIDNPFRQKCIVHTEANDQRIRFKSGTSICTIGALLMGGQSGATGLVKEQTVETGTFETFDATGYLILSFVEGTFEDDERLQDDGIIWGQCVCDGTNEENSNDYMPATTTWFEQEVACKFQTPRGGTVVLASGERVTDLPKVMIPGNITVREGDKVSSEITGFAGPFIVRKVYPIGTDDRIHHWRCDLEML